MNKSAELNAFSNWKPVEVTKKRRNMDKFGFLENKPSTPVLDRGHEEEEKHGKIWVS